MSEPIELGSVVLPAAGDTHDFGVRLGRLLGAGDLVVLSGPLGAGKTALSQGIGVGLQVAGDVTSPTFVIARIHRSAVGGPDLVHVDAYRLGSLAEVDDLDLDASIEESVTVVEWGEGKVEDLSEDRLLVELSRAEGQVASLAVDGSDLSSEAPGPLPGAVVAERRTASIIGIGPRWAERSSALRDLLASFGPHR